MADTKTSFLQLGNVKFTYEVQNIAIQEQKGIDIINTPRSSENIAVDTKSSYKKVQVSLILVGRDEIVRGISNLLALFKTCPITSVYNETISTFAQDKNSETMNIQRDLFDSYDVPQHNYNRMDFVPVAFEEIIIRSVPDLVDTVSIELSLVRIDTLVHLNRNNTQNQQLLYIQKDPESATYDPAECYWLDKWITKLVNGVNVPMFDMSEFNIVSNKIVEFGEEKRPVVSLNLIPKDDSLGLSYAFKLRNYFSYNKLIGKYIPYAQYMGSSAPVLSIDLLFKTDSFIGQKNFESFCRIKDISEIYLKNRSRERRIFGWTIENPIISLVNKLTNSDKDIYYAPIAFTLNTAGTPNLKQVSADFAQINTRHISEQEILLESDGGYDYSTLKNFYDKIVAEEYAFRTKTISSLKPDERFYINRRMATANPEELNLINSFTTFWAVNTLSPEATTTSIKRTDDYALLNIDTLRAALLSNRVDTDGSLKTALINSIQATGKVLLQDYKSNFFERSLINANTVATIVRGIEEGSPELSKIYKEILKIVDSGRFVNLSKIVEANTVAVISVQLLIGLLGDYKTFDITSETGALIKTISASIYDFSDEFKSALFDVIVERQDTPPLLPHVYSTDGIFTAFKKLITEYNNLQLTIEETDTSYRDQLDVARSKLYKGNAYPDLILPTYEELFGSEWKSYGLTYEDLGIKSHELKDIRDDNYDKALIVDAEDYVHPAIWFYNQRKKEDIRSVLDSEYTSTNDPLERNTINIPFDVSRLERAEQLIQKGNRTKEEQLDLVTILQEGVDQLQATDNEAFRRAMSSLQTVYGTNAPIDPKSKQVWIYISSKDKPIQRRRVTFPGLGGELYRLARDKHYIEPTKELPKLHEDAVYKSSGRDEEYKFERNSLEATNATIRSSMDQIEDDQFSYRKLFPTVKVYIIDVRGNDVYSDDSFFSTNAVISVDVTQDKDDADLAIISIADPLYYLQSSTFALGYVDSYKTDIAQASTSVDRDLDPNHTKIVLDSMFNNNVAGYLKRYKIAQGRAVMIKMGYDANPKNLKTVFTGKISEIQPGDILTLVCQGWKSELINRQVSFYNDDPNSWGARDLAIQAIVKANPEGLGEHFNQRDTNALLKGLSDLDSVMSLSKSLQNTTSIRLDEQGESSIWESIEAFGRSKIGLGSQLKHNVGLDTRLKNIWYPDVPNYSNLLGWRSALGCPPDYMNDSWVVPLKPCWEVLKEASRHAWNCVVQVLPYDGRATIFMGHPDQPYYYTRSNPRKIKDYLKHKDKSRKNNDEVLAKLVEGFLQSNYYSDESQVLTEFFTNINGILNDSTKHDKFFSIDPFNIMEYDHNDYSNFNYFKYNAFDTNTVTPTYVLVQILMSVYNGRQTKGPPSFEGLPFGNIVDYAAGAFIRADHKNYTGLENSSKPQTMYDSIRNTVFGEQTVLLLLQAFYGISFDDLYIQNPGIDRFVNTLVTNEPLGEEDLAQIAVDYSDDIINSVEKGLKMLVELRDDTSNIGLSFFGVPYSSGGFLPSLNRTPLVPATIQEKINIGLNRLLSVVRSVKDQRLNQQIVDVMDTISDTTGPSAYVMIKALLDGEEYREDFDGMYVARYAVILLDDIYFVLLSLQNKQTQKTQESLPKFGIAFDYSKPLVQNLIEHRNHFKSFVYFFGQYLLTEQGGSLLSGLVGTKERVLPPTMQVFRVHHYLSNDVDIIQNNISCSIKEMWNTVVIEHPAKGEGYDAAAASDSDLFTQQNISSAVQWQYWPKNEVSGVMGYQFHPGLSLVNKKVQVKTELNAYSPELVAKLACNHLAEGMRRMYRGTLLFRGRHIKPHDRIILDDKYTKMKGPIEVESVVHHFSLATGWVTNIIPQLVAEANSGASILQTARLEAGFNIAFNAVEYFADLAVNLLALAALGGASSLAVGEFSTLRALLPRAKQVATLSPVKLFNSSIKAQAANLSEVGRILKTAGPATAKIGQLYKRFGGPVNSYIGIEVARGILNNGGHAAFRLNVVNSYIKHANELKNLPVIISPLIYNDRALLAGLETDKPIWDVYLNQTFYNIKSIQAGAEKVIEQLIEDLNLPTYDDPARVR